LSSYNSGKKITYQTTGHNKQSKIAAPASSEQWSTIINQKFENYLVRSKKSIVKLHIIHQNVKHCLTSQTTGNYHPPKIRAPPSTQHGNTILHQTVEQSPSKQQRTIFQPAVENNLPASRRAQSSSKQWTKIIQKEVEHNHLASSGAQSSDKQWSTIQQAVDHNPASSGHNHPASSRPQSSSKQWTTIIQ
jgi:hypothetical protein